MHGQIPVVWDKARFQVYDKWGNKWLDFSSTIFVQMQVTQIRDY